MVCNDRTKRRILIYNWVPFDDPVRGGGVTVYTKNLIDEFCKKNSEYELFFICSGVYYDSDDPSVRVEELKANYNVNCKMYAIINSPVFSPAYLSFYHIERTLNSPILKDVFADFLKSEGPFDVVHFQNLEGLSVNVLECKRDFEETRFIYSVHNYYPFCPQVNLWKGSNENCVNECTGEECIKCMSCHVPDRKLIEKMAMTYKLRCNYSEAAEHAFALKGKLLDEEYSAEEKRELTIEEYQQLKSALSLYRKTFVNYIDKYIDKVLAVSKRVKEICCRYGVPEEKVQISYIGTKAADNAINYCKNTSAEKIKLVYMGYRRKDKGFFFLIDVLNELNKELAHKIDLVLAARIDNSTKQDWYLDETKFNSVVCLNGYKREDIPAILGDANLGIVPPLWEDNLPQVAIEMASFGVPVFCSDRGGANELTENKKFVFEAGNIDDCVEKLEYLLENTDEIKDYYFAYKGLTTMEAHVQELNSLYKG